MIEVSIIVPMWNAARTIERCLEALVEQDAPASSYEILVIDNNSTDGSPELARRFVARGRNREAPRVAAEAAAPAGDRRADPPGPAVRLLTEPRQGAYAARNRGIGVAAGRLLAFTDPDCVARPDWLLRLVEAMADPAAMVVTGRDRPAGATRAVRLLGEYDHVKEAWVTEREDASAYYAHTNNLITRRQVIDRVGLFDQRARGADVIFVQRVLALHGTGAVRYQPRALVDHLEIASAGVYFRKAFLYGRSARRYSQVVRARPLRNAERFEIFRQTVRRSELSATDRALLFALLGVGVGCYRLGWHWGSSSLDAAATESREQPT